MYFKKCVFNYFIGILFVFFLLYFYVAKSSSLPSLRASFDQASISSVESNMQRRYQVKNLACTYREQLYAMARNKSNSFEDLLAFHRLIDSLSLDNGTESPDPYSFKQFDDEPGIKWAVNIFSLRHADAPKVTKDFLICLPQKAGTSNWQIAFAKLFKTKEEMAARGVVLADDSQKNVFYPRALYEFVPRFHTVKHAALLEGKGKRYLNTRDPFTRARSGTFEA